MAASAERPRRKWAGKLVRIFLGVLVTLLVLIVIRAAFAFRDRSPGYEVRLAIKPAAAVSTGGQLRVGFGRVKINPELSNPNRPVYIAGFGQNRRATALHDDLWSVACVLDDGHARLGIVSLDAIGFFHDYVVEVRKRVSAGWKLDYIVVCSTHNHSTPDLMGLWGPHPFRSGVDAAYLRQVIEACVQALGSAVSNLTPAQVAMHTIPCPTDGLVTDTRPPKVFDPDIHVMHFVNATNGSTLGALINWANHPETPWSRNTELTAGFCGYLRDALEHGVVIDGKRYTKGLGGVHCYINGAIGGLMTTSPSVTVRDPFTEEAYKTPSHEKARAVAHQLLQRILPRLTGGEATFTGEARIGILARTIEIPMDNNLYLLAGFLGVLDRGYVHWRRLRSEVALLTFGEASIACVPGELYPEIANGGVETPAGADFDIEPVEVPPLRELMPGRHKFLFGLANDEIGYLIPKTQWDREAPYTYAAKRPHYGEINSCGPDAGATVYKALAELCRDATANAASSGQ